MHVCILIAHVGISCELEQKELLLQLCGETASTENLFVLRSVLVTYIALFTIYLIERNIGRVNFGEKLYLAK